MEALILLFPLVALIAGIFLWYFSREQKKRIFQNQDWRSLETFQNEDSPSTTIRLTFPIVTDPSDVQPGEEFRLEKDPKNVIRIRWRKPQEATYPYMAVKDVSVAGISQANVRTNVLSFIAGTERSLALVRDPQNKFDKNAIKVIGNWKTKSGGTNSGQLGWVPREIAEEIAEDKDLANAHLYPTLRTIFLPSAGKSAGLRFDIWI